MLLKYVLRMPEKDSCLRSHFHAGLKGFVDAPPRRVSLSWLQVKVPVSESGSGVGERGARGWRAGADMAVSPDRDLDDTGRERGSRRGRSRGYR